MKRILILTLVLSLLAIPSAALAGGQIKVFNLADNSLESSFATEDPAELARVWIDEDSGLEDECDKFDWPIDITTKATVAQWIKWRIDFTEWNWQVRKPGVFATDGNALHITSNDDVNVKFSATDLVSQTHPGAPNIDAAYGWDKGVGAGVSGDTMPAGAPASGWQEAPFTDRVLPISYAEFVAAGSTNWVPVRLWNKIAITDFTRACNYEGTGLIVISVTDKKDFIDGESGNFKEPKVNPYAPAAGA